MSIVGAEQFEQDEQVKKEIDDIRAKDKQEETSEAEVPTHAHGDLPAPNGGFIAWIQVAGAFCLFFNTWLVG
jgi:hypothetical protein